MNGYYSVFDPDGKKIADCGIERDAVNLMQTRNKYWDGHYFTFNPLPGDIIDVSNGKQLPPVTSLSIWMVVLVEVGVRLNTSKSTDKNYNYNNLNYLN